MNQKKTRYTASELLTIYYRSIFKFQNIIDSDNTLYLKIDEKFLTLVNTGYTRLPRKMVDELNNVLRTVFLHHKPSIYEITQAYKHLDKLLNSSHGQHAFRDIIGEDLIQFRLTYVGAFVVFLITIAVLMLWATPWIALGIINWKDIHDATQIMYKKTGSFSPVKIYWTN